MPAEVTQKGTDENFILNVALCARGSDGEEGGVQREIGAFPGVRGHVCIRECRRDRQGIAGPAAADVELRPGLGRQSASCAARAREGSFTVPLRGGVGDEERVSRKARFAAGHGRRGRGRKRSVDVEGACTGERLRGRDAENGFYAAAKAPAGPGLPVGEAFLRGRETAAPEPYDTVPACVKGAVHA